MDEERNCVTGILNSWASRWQYPGRLPREVLHRYSTSLPHAYCARLSKGATPFAPPGALCEMEINLTPDQEAFVRPIRVSVEAMRALDPVSSDLVLLV